MNRLLLIGGGMCSMRIVASILFLVLACAGCAQPQPMGKAPSGSAEKIQRSFVVFYFPTLKKTVFVTGTGVADVEFVSGASSAQKTIEGLDSKKFTLIGDVKLRVRGVLLEANDARLSLNGMSMDRHLAAVINASGEILLDAYIREDFD